MQNRPHSPTQDMLFRAYELYRNCRHGEADGLCAEIEDVYADHVQFMNLRGLIKRNLNDAEESSSFFYKALALNPGEFDPLYNLAGNAADAEDFEQAIRFLRFADVIRPEHAELYYNLGIILQRMNRIKESEEAYSRAIGINPDFGAAYNNLGGLYKLTGKKELAATFFRKAIAADRMFVMPWNNLGAVTMMSGYPFEAITHFGNALRIDPAYVDALTNLASAFKDAGDTAQALGLYHRALAAEPDSPVTRSTMLLTYSYGYGFDREFVYKEHLKYAESLNSSAICRQGAQNSSRRKKSGRRKNGIIRIGYVSPDFKAHPVANFIAPILSASDYSSFHVHLYSNSAAKDGITETFMGFPVTWREIAGMSDRAAFKLIKNDGIDILIDLAGHTDGNRLSLFALKPAGIQVTWIGYPNTTGLSAIDYRFTDELADPPGEADRLHSERLYRLKHGFICYQPYKETPEVSPPPHLKSGKITFASFNNASKISDKCIQLWSELLKRTEDSRLILKSRQFADPGVVNRFRNMFSGKGVAPERVEFRPWVSSNLKFLEPYSEADIALDTLPYNGTTTTCEALWMGVPVVTLQGDRHASRVGTSILTRVGLPELVARNEEEYVHETARLARDAKRLQAYRSTLRAQLASSVLCNAGLIASTVEKAYLTMLK